MFKEIATDRANSQIAMGNTIKSVPNAVQGKLEKVAMLLFGMSLHGSSNIAKTSGEVNAEKRQKVYGKNVPQGLQMVDSYMKDAVISSNNNINYNTYNYYDSKGKSKQPSKKSSDTSTPTSELLKSGVPFKDKKNVFHVPAVWLQDRSSGEKLVDFVSNWHGGGKDVK